MGARGLSAFRMASTSTTTTVMPFRVKEKMMHRLSQPAHLRAKRSLQNLTTAPPMQPPPVFALPKARPLGVPHTPIPQRTTLLRASPHAPPPRRRIRFLLKLRPPPHFWMTLRTALFPCALIHPPTMFSPSPQRHIEAGST
jgi:hypothetical protein